MFKEKQLVTYPFHGVGVIEKITKHQIDGVHVDYYSVRFKETGIVVEIPMEKAKKLGLSDLPEKKDFIKEIEKLGENYKITDKRIKEIKNINAQDLNTNEIAEIVDIFNKIYSYDEYREKKLQVSLKQIIVKASNFLRSVSRELLPKDKFKKHPKIKLLLEW